MKFSNAGAICIGICFLFTDIQAQDISVDRIQRQINASQAQIDRLNEDIGRQTESLMKAREGTSTLFTSCMRRCDSHTDSFWNRLRRRGSSCKNNCRKERREQITQLQESLKKAREDLAKFQDQKNTLEVQLRTHQRLVQCRQRQQELANIQAILNAEEMKINQEIDYNEGHSQCRAGNSWFQAQIPASHDEADFDQSLDRRCTYRILKDYTKCDTQRRCYVKCDGRPPENDTRPEYTSTPPCVSRRFHNYVHNTITEISSCLQLDPKILFSLFLNESGVHPLRRSHTNAVGAGQMTSVFIEDIGSIRCSRRVNNQCVDTKPSLFDEYINETLPALSKNPLTGSACRSVLNKVSTFGKVKSIPAACQRTNHYMNVYYSAIHLIRSMDFIIPKVLRSRGQRNMPVPENSSFRHALGSGLLGEDSRKTIENLAKFQAIDVNDRNIIIEASLYSHIMPVTRYMFSEYINNEGLPQRFKDFTGTQGGWVSFLKTRRDRISSREGIQNQVIQYIYRPNARSGSSGMMKEKMNKVEEANENLFREKISCRPYYDT